MRGFCGDGDDLAKLIPKSVYPKDDLQRNRGFYKSRHGIGPGGYIRPESHLQAHHNEREFRQCLHDLLAAVVVLEKLGRMNERLQLVVIVASVGGGGVSI